jgi:hypothetical protein
MCQKEAAIFTHNTGDSMNPFEIRAKLLDQAHGYLEKQFEINTEFAKEVFAELVKQGDKVAEDWQQYAPKIYTMDEVLEKAKTLYGFVNNVK